MLQFTSVIASLPDRSLLLLLADDWGRVGFCLNGKGAVDVDALLLVEVSFDGSFEECLFVGCVLIIWDVFDDAESGFFGDSPGMGLLSGLDVDSFFFSSWLLVDDDGGFFTDCTVLDVFDLAMGIVMVSFDCFESFVAEEAGLEVAPVFFGSVLVEEIWGAFLETLDEDGVVTTAGDFFAELAGGALPLFLRLSS